MKTAFTLFVCITLLAGITSLAAGTRSAAVSEGSTRANGCPDSDAASGRIYGIGYVEPASGVRRLAFRSSGIIAECGVTVGDDVQAGVPLARLDTQQLEAKVEIARQQLEVARAERAKVLSGVDAHSRDAAGRNVERCRERLELARREHERNAKMNDAISRAAYDQSASEVVQRRAELLQATAEWNHLREFVRPEDRRLADANVAVAEASLASLRQQIQDRTLFAPIDGTVLEVLHRDGECVSSIEPQPVILFADTSRLQVRAEIDERFVDQLHEGMRATVSGTGLGGRLFTGQVATVKQIMGQKTVFARAAHEQKELDVIQLIVETDEPLPALIGLRVDVQLDAR